MGFFVIPQAVIGGLQLQVQLILRLGLSSFNAARGMWSVATTASSSILPFNAFSFNNEKLFPFKDVKLKFSEYNKFNDLHASCKSYFE